MQAGSGQSRRQGRITSVVREADHVESEVVGRLSKVGDAQRLLISELKADFRKSAVGRLR